MMRLGTALAFSQFDETGARRPGYIVCGNASRLPLQLIKLDQFGERYRGSGCSRHNYAATSREDLSYGQGSPFRWATNSSSNFSTIEIVGSAAASPSGQNVRPSMFLARSPISTMSLRWPMPSWNRVSSLRSQLVPSRQGMHHPQLSCA